MELGALLLESAALLVIGTLMVVLVVMRFDLQWPGRRRAPQPTN
jgi:hypothetical protein